MKEYLLSSFTKAGHIFDNKFWSNKVINKKYWSKNDNRDYLVSIIEFWLFFILFYQQFLELGVWIFKNAQAFLKAATPPPTITTHLLLMTYPNGRIRDSCW